MAAGSPMPHPPARSTRPSRSGSPVGHSRRPATTPARRPLPVPPPSNPPNAESHRRVRPRDLGEELRARTRRASRPSPTVPDLPDDWARRADFLCPAYARARRRPDHSGRPTQCLVTRVHEVAIPLACQVHEVGDRDAGTAIDDERYCPDAWFSSDHGHRIDPRRQ